MPVLYGNHTLSILVLSAKKTLLQFFEKTLLQFFEKALLQFFEKGFRFPENLFQSESIEIVQNFHCLSHKNMPIS